MADLPCNKITFELTSFFRDTGQKVGKICKKLDFPPKSYFAVWMLISMHGSLSRLNFKFYTDNAENAYVLSTLYKAMSPIPLST